ncbi:hypothetical protein BDW62DRAFT_175539 [Aspergillus aurantiobrunneus]
MTPSYTVPSSVIQGGSKGILVISHLNEPFPACATKTVRLAVRNGLKVADFVDIFEREKRHLYELNDCGQGLSVLGG